MKIPAMPAVAGKLYAWIQRSQATSNPTRESGAQASITEGKASRARAGMATPVPFADLSRPPSASRRAAGLA